MNNKLRALSYLVMFAPLAAQAPAPVAPQAYRVEFVLNRSQPGKNAVSHTYTMVLQAHGGNASMVVGRRIPIREGPEKFDYQYIGTRLSCILSDKSSVLAGELSLRVEVSVSSADPESALPTIQSTEANVATQVALGRRISIAQFQDPDSHASYDLEILITSMAVRDAAEAGT